MIFFRVGHPCCNQIQSCSNIPSVLGTTFLLVYLSLPMRMKVEREAKSISLPGLLASLHKAATFKSRMYVHTRPVLYAKFLVPDWVGYSRLWHRVVSPACRAAFRLVGRYDSPMPVSTISPSQGKRICVLYASVVLTYFPVVLHPRNL
jgi:hypothetical protein